MSDESPKQSVRRVTSGERAVRLPKRASEDRRAAPRYPLTLAVRYVVQNKRRRVVTTGLGQTVDLSSCGVRFTTDSSLEPGLRLKLFIAWPVLLDGAVELQLTMEGTVVRSSNKDVSMRIERRGFRTRGRGLKTA
jgi:hypothetical protein